jgi:demethylmenaquinone methyltransferase/2-methoxy-6-polyprenyl-1,4-benzoquinol methylase
MAWTLSGWAETRKNLSTLLPSIYYALFMTESGNRPSPTPTPGKGLSVQRLFSRIARRYDLANHLLSGGFDFFWRRRAAKIVQAWKPERLLDLATGSGDLARALSRACRKTFVVGADFCLPMLRVARRKGLKHLVQADGLRLPFAEASFDVVTIAFGLRNMESWQQGLSEMHRVLRPGGHLLILDFSVPQGKFRRPYRFYLHRILPRLAAMVTGEKSAYEYLADSIETFPQGAAMEALLEEQGYSMARCEPLTGGIVSLYTAEKKSATTD